MLKRLTLLIITALFFAACAAQAVPAAPTPTSAAAGQAISEQDAIALAERLLESLLKNDFAGATQKFDDTMRAALPEAQLKAVWENLAGQVGAYQERVGTPVVETVDPYRRVVITLKFEKATLDMRVVVDTRTGLISGLFFAPNQSALSAQYQPPEYADASAFEERAVTVGQGEWSLPGTLTMPKGSGLFPAVVLVHGSGPNDRDESIGPNKPFKDIAWGLASRGIAVLRYDKRTRVYGDKVAALGNFTVKEEAIDDTLAAVALLRQTDGIDPQRVFVLGHSLGGTLAPRIAQADAQIGGIIILAGATRPLEDLMVEQTQYLLELDGEFSADDQKQMEELEKQVAAVKALSAPDTLQDKTLLGAPPQHWIDLQGYNPVRVASALSQPMFILQGERDYQVTLEDFKRWEDGLSSRSNVTLKTYLTLNHLFIAGTGTSTPDEYQQLSHVAVVVIDDVAAWIGQQP